MVLISCRIPSSSKLRSTILRSCLRKVSDPCIILTGTYNDTAMHASDSGSVFSFTVVKLAPSCDHSEHLTIRAIFQIVRIDGIAIESVRTHRCCRPGMNLISYTLDPVNVVSLFGISGVSASHRDASR